MMHYIKNISINLNIPDSKGSQQIVNVLTMHRDTKQTENVRIRVNSINPDMAIIDACKQVLGVIESKGTSLVIKPNDQVPTHQIIGAWLVP